MKADTKMCQEIAEEYRNNMPGTMRTSSTAATNLTMKKTIELDEHSKTKANDDELSSEQCSVSTKELI
jgi:alanine dehydrogenase